MLFDSQKKQARNICDCISDEARTADTWFENPCQAKIGQVKIFTCLRAVLTSAPKTAFQEREARRISVATFDWPSNSLWQTTSDDTHAPVWSWVLTTTAASNLRTRIRDGQLSRATLPLAHGPIVEGIDQAHTLDVLRQAASSTLNRIHT